jgi:hypothetical protein
MRVTPSRKGESMPLDVKKVDYYNLTVEEQIAEAASMLGQIVGAGVDFLAYKAVPAGSARTRFTLFPIDGDALTAGAEKAGLAVDGPHPAVLVVGDEQPGALAGIYARLAAADIAVEESAGIAHINDGYGVVLYLRDTDCDRALVALAD